MAVLFVEDDFALADMLHVFAETMEIDHAIAYNGQEAFALYCEQPFELVATDINMPLMDGMQLAQRLRQLEPGVKLFAITGGCLNYSQAELKSVFQRIFFKPGDISRMMGEIAKTVHHDAHHAASIL